MWVPLLVKDHLVGGVSLAHHDPDRFSPQIGELVLTVANQAAIALETTRLYEAARDFAAVQERQRLARDLHDAVTQTLFSASLIAEVLPRLWERRPEDVHRNFRELQHLARSALAEMRTLLLELRPAALTKQRLGELVTQLAEGMQGRLGAEVSIAVDGQCTLPDAVHLALYRIMQEALHNIAKHAAATRVGVRLHCDPQAVALAIHDHGRGFDPDRASAGHFGIGIMRERAAAIGATLEIQSTLHADTSIRVWWPEPGAPPGDPAHTPGGGRA
jgi:two-component system nitrate/nitrite sensor histidine kinase NarX